uniref:HTH OST-type domain-containing protein n=1 Tax=Glossina brevipalpis TaxID=37001 RepID=A0A1A9W5J8_9MUSC
MAERFHSVRQDDISKIYMNNNANPISMQAQVIPTNQHTQQQQQQRHGTEQINLVAAANIRGPLKNDFDYLPSAGLYTTPISRSVADLNNNRISLTKYSGNQTANNCYSSKFLSSMPSLNSLINNCATMNTQNMYHNHPHMSTPVTNRLYANTNQLYQNSFHRNRYMPYSRSGFLPEHQTNSVMSGALSSNSIYYGMAQYSETIFQMCRPPLLASFTCNGPLVQMPSSTTTLHCTTPSISIHKTTNPLTQNLLAVEANYIHATGKTTSSMQDEGTSASIVASSTKTTNKSLVTSLGTASSANTAPTRNTCITSSTNSTTDAVTLQITNLDYSMDETSLRTFLLGQLDPITPVISLVFEGTSFAKVTVPDINFAKLVVSNLHRKKIGHKRMLVSYTRDSSLTEFNTLRCQVAGLLKDVPSYTLPMYKFRELFQSRFKTSISVLDLYKMPDICTINADNNEEKFISLHPELVNSFESSPLMEGLQHSVPYCTIHFKREQHKGWAEQEIEPLPNVCMSITEIQKILRPLLKNHPGDIPIASLVHCIEAQLDMHITPDDNGVNLEHLICCVPGVQLQINNFGIKILTWVDTINNNNNNNKERESLNAVVCAAIGGGNSGNEKGNSHGKNSITEALYQISREVIELVKMSPKATMKFNRFIPAYHNHFGKQCRVADYGYTKLIELFEALSPVIQIMGDGENRQITLTHRIQVRRFTSDLLRILRTHWSKSILLSQLPEIFAQTQNRQFDVTDYGVCELTDIFDGLVNTNIVLMLPVHDGKDLLISMPKRQQTSNELEKTCIFAGEVVELFRNAPQYSILFQKFVRSYHYHFGYQCRLSDYGFLRLADLLEAINGVVEIELTADEDKKILLSPIIARRIFAKQCEELIRDMTGIPSTCIKLDEVLKMHKKRFGYQMQSQTLGSKNMNEGVQQLPYVELILKGDCPWIICHGEDNNFRNQCYRACKYLLSLETEKDEQNEENMELEMITHLTVKKFITNFNEKYKENLAQTKLHAMRHAIELKLKNNEYYVCLTNFTKFLMKIVRLLEYRSSSMTILEIKNALDCDIHTTFQYGYPNLYSLIIAHPDIFSVGPTSTHEKAEVTLVKNTEMNLGAFANNKTLFGSLKLPLNKQKVMRTIRTPLTEYNSHVSFANNQGPPPVKTRALSNDTNQPNYSYSQQAYNSNQLSLNVNSINTSNTQNNLSSSSSAYSMESNALDTSYTASIGKENSSSSSSAILNNSFNGGNQSFASCFSSSDNSNLSNTNLPSLLLPVSPSVPSSLVLADQTIHSQQQYHPYYPQVFYSSTKLYNRRNNSSFYQQQIPKFLPNNVTPLGSATNINDFNPMACGETMDASTGFYELVNNMRMYPMYEPPKPDTPPSANTPFWIDPIWTNNTNAEKPSNDLLNIRLPDLRALNVLPMLLSPYSISKIENMKKIFNFESQDRKIA